MKDTKILYVCSEIMPYLPETEISKVCRQLPQAIQEMGNEIRTFTPRYGCINDRRHQLHEVIRLSGLNLIINDNDHPLIIKVASISSARMQVYFIDNEDYFHRKQLFADTACKTFPDNDERMIFFARGVLETVKKLQWKPDIIHCHGWFSYMIPLFLKRTYKDNVLLNSAKVLLSLYDDNFKGTLDKNIGDKLIGKSIKQKHVESLLEKPDYETFVKFAVDYSDGVIYGSEKISDEIDKYVKSTKKDILEYQDCGNYYENYVKFYEKFL